MKLYLSSYKLGDHPEKLYNLFSTNKKVGLIMNALDFSKDKERLEQSTSEHLESLKNIGLEPELLDLKNYFNQQYLLERKLNKLGGLWVVGGNTFVLLRAYELCGLNSILTEYHKHNNAFVYGGFSAGCCVLQNSLKGIEFVDDPSLVQEAYGKEAIWNGLGIIDFVFVPHYDSDHPESEDTDKEIEYYNTNNILYKPLRDGEVLIYE